MFTEKKLQDGPGEWDQDRVVEGRVMKYIYTYLDGAMNDTEMGPYNTKEEAEEHRSRHASFGAMTMPVKEVPDDYKPYKPHYD